jgi:PPK2 family polyphosphate:nucleotide phosphotransferase
MKILNEISTKPAKGFDKKKAKKEIKALQKEFAVLQNKMYAQGKHSLLIVVQGMDASGKDGLVKNVFREIPAYGVSVKSFKVPSKEELAHDFLWRVHKATPKKGMIKVFNRSHYEEVLVVRSLGFVDDEQAKDRFRILNNFEEIVAQNRTTILKFYLHTSYDEQKNRLKERMTNPEKYWKHNDGDWETRAQWDKFRVYYQDVIDNCSVPFEWNVIPADENRYKELLVLRKIVETMKSLDLKYPDLETELEIPTV